MRSGERAIGGLLPLPVATADFYGVATAAAQLARRR